MYRGSHSTQNSFDFLKRSCNSVCQVFYGWHHHVVSTECIGGRCDSYRPVPSPALVIDLYFRSSWRCVCVCGGVEVQPILLLYWALIGVFRQRLIPSAVPFVRHCSILGQRGSWASFKVLVDHIWVNDQLDAQLRYITCLLLLSCTCFEQQCAHHQQVELY